MERINLGSDQHLAHVVVTEDGDYAFVTALARNQIIQIDANTLEVVKRIDLGENHEPHGLRCQDGKLYVANMKGQSLSVIDINNQQIKEITLGGKAVQTALTSRYAFVALYDTKEVAQYSLTQDSLINTISLPSSAEGPIQIYPTPNDKFLYVCDQGGRGDDPVSNKVFVINVDSAKVTHTIETQDGPHGVVSDNKGKYVYITNNFDHSVSVVNVKIQAVVKTLFVGRHPKGISFRSPDGGML